MKTLWAWLSTLPKIIEQVWVWVQKVELYIKTQNAKKNTEKKRQAFEDKLNKSRVVNDIERL